ncbi:MAG: CocE/NonD family hydrolase [Clostridiales Family XIII bacterium]|jgi:predicted acyl esterase|nr:CocE/NonD family hydrolase [Clostridiales Family XIII bacterium]
MSEDKKIEIFVKKEVFNGKEFEVAYRKAREPVDPEEGIDLSKAEGIDSTAHGFCAKFNQRLYKSEDGIICEQDVPMTLSDGAVIYCDIYRKDGDGNIPALVSWSYYGKRPGDGMSEWQIMGVPPGTVSRMAKFESPDPSYWCHYGYAVVNVDPRGVGHSGGDVNMFGGRDARDGAEFIEWLAERHWCNGRIGMSGNSGVAMPQLRIAALQPPHLTCIAPWEQTNDIYSESIYEGGIPALSFNEFIISSITGPNLVDDLVENGRRYPLFNDYWADKVPDTEKIKIPVYMTLSYHHFHCHGSITAFRKIRSTRKWMRMHREQEWPDQFTPKNLDDLRRFFDRYLKGINNGWEMTPRYRIEVMDAYDINYQTDRPEKEYPLKRTEYTRFYLDAKNKVLARELPPGPASLSYDSEKEEAEFDFVFEEETEVTGYIWVRLWVESKEHDEMDLFINVRKLDENGEWLPNYILGEPHPGSWGKLRVSHREIDEDRTTKFEPWHPHTSEQKLKPGEIVPVDIAIVPSSRIFHAGQGIRLQIAGRYIREGWFEPLSWETDNKGVHIIHAGGQYDSFIQLPVIPPKYKTKDGYTYR